MSFQGKKHTIETKNKMRKARIGIVFTQEHKDNIRKNHSTVWKGGHLTEEQKKKISMKHKGRIITPGWRKKLSLAKIGKPSPMKGKRFPERSGANCSLWKGGISFEPYTTDWTYTLKKAIRQRDNYTCTVCGTLQGDIAHDVHHIDYNKKNCNSDNLITLCHSCHAKTNFNRGHWINYFNN